MDTATDTTQAAAATTDTAQTATADTLFSGGATDTKTGGGTDGGNQNPFAALLNADGSFVDGWPNLLQGDEYGDLRATAQNYKTLPALLKGLKDSKAAAMAKTEGMIRLPGDDAKPEDVAAFRKALGVPDSPDGYQVPADLIPPDMALDETVFGEFKTVAHQAGLTAQQVQALAKWQLGMESTRNAQAAAQAEADLKAEAAKLQQEWGNQYQAKVSLARRAAETFGLDVESNPIFRDAAVVRAFAGIAAAISEDKLVSSESVSNRLSPVSQADDILKNPANRYHAAYHDAKNPMHGEAVALWQDLMRKAYPG